MKDGSYYTVAGPGSSELTVEKSKFIARVSPAATVEDALGFIKSIREMHPDATHNVPAYIVGESGDERWSSEDGEPKGTSGAPVLALIAGEGLTNVCVVVTRYFGGIKLGTGGLVRAYTEVARAALEDAGKAEVKVRKVITFVTDYASFNRIKALSGQVFDIVSEKYTDKVEFEAAVDAADETVAIKSITDISSGTAKVINKTDRPFKIFC